MYTQAATENSATSENEVPPQARNLFLSPDMKRTSPTTLRKLYWDFSPRFQAGRSKELKGYEVQDGKCGRKR